MPDPIIETLEAEMLDIDAYGGVLQKINDDELTTGEAIADALVDVVSEDVRGATWLALFTAMVAADMCVAGLLNGTYNTVYCEG